MKPAVVVALLLLTVALLWAVPGTVQCPYADGAYGQLVTCNDDTHSKVCTYTHGPGAGVPAHTWTVTYQVNQ